MRRLIGYLLMAIGGLHVLFVFATMAGPLSDIGRDGLFGAIGSHPEREIAFWSLLFGLLIITVGYMTHWVQARTGALPAFLGWTVLGIGVFGVILMPISGFWSAVLTSVLALVASRQDRIRPTATTVSAGSRHGRDTGT